MQARAIDSSPVIDQRGELLGILSKNKMNRNVGGFGHDPKTEPVEAHIEKNNAYCFEDQTIAEAEQMMLNAKLGEVFVVTREKLLVGTINIEAIAQEGKKLGSRINSESLRRTAAEARHLILANSKTAWEANAFQLGTTKTVVVSAVLSGGTRIHFICAGTAHATASLGIGYREASSR